ncbi:MAG TPA: retropepsin-like aspartic protease [Desulfuromonadaceae bacterium]
MTINQNQVLIPVTLSYGNRTIEARLVLDTGASITVISTNLAEKLNINLDRAPRSHAQVVGGGIVTGWHTRLDRISAGPHTRAGIDVAVIPHNGRGMAIEGLLGMDFLRNYKYHIDFNSQSIDWTY